MQIKSCRNTKVVSLQPCDIVLFHENNNQDENSHLSWGARSIAPLRQTIEYSTNDATFPRVGDLPWVFSQCVLHSMGVQQLTIDRLTWSLPVRWLTYEAIPEHGGHVPDKNANAWEHAGGIHTDVMIKGYHIVRSRAAEYTTNKNCLK